MCSYVFPHDPVDYNAQLQNCIRQLDCCANSSCYKSFYEAEFHRGWPFPTPSIQCPNGISIYNYDKNADPCDFYKKGSRFPFELEYRCGPISSSITKSSLYFGNCTSDKQAFGKRLIEEIKANELDLKNRYEEKIRPEGCYELLEKEAADKNAEDIDILLGCKRPWAVIGSDPIPGARPVDVNGTPPCDGFFCTSDIFYRYIDFSVKPDPNWQPPSPRPEWCSPPPPPPPPPSPPPLPPPPPTNCVGGGNHEGVTPGIPGEPLPE